MKLHHIGIVVGNLEDAVNYYKNTFGLKAIGEPVVDPIQKVEVVFIETGFGQDLTIELIKPLNVDSPVHTFLQKGGGVHHLSYEVENIHETAEDLKKKGALIISDFAPGKGHDDRLTLWVYTSEKELVELVEKEKR